MGVSSDKCKADLARVAEVCNTLTAPIPKLGENLDEEALKAYGVEYGNCLIDNHVQLLKRDKQKVDSCLETGEKSN